MARGRMLTRDRLQLINEQLAQGYPIAEIARNVGVSHDTVQRVQAGTHPLQTNPTHTRCTGCGGMVVQPCLRCSLRALPAAG